MPAPTNGSIPAQFLGTMAGGVPAELNTAAAFNRLHDAHPGVHTNGAASGYWTHALDIDIHAHPGNYNISPSEAKALSPIGSSPHGLGTRINFSGVSETVAAQFDFRAFRNAYTYDYTGTPSWQTAIEHNLTSDEVKRVAAYLNGRALGRVTTAAQTGINVLPDETESNYYWEVQRAGKIDGVYPQGDLLNGIPGPATYAAELHYRDLTAPAPAPAPVTPPAVAPVASAPAPVADPVTPPAPATPGPSTTPTAAPPTPVPKAPTVTAPKPPTKADLDAYVAQLQADSDSLQITTTGLSLSGILAGHTKLRRRSYVAWASLALVVSFGPDIVTAGFLSAHVDTVLVAVIGISSSVLLKIGVAVGFVAASNAQG